MHFNPWFLTFQDIFGRSPLHCCAKSGSVETLQMLASLNCDLSSVDSEGRTAVYWAIGTPQPLNYCY